MFPLSTRGGFPAVKPTESEEFFIFLLSAEEWKCAWMGKLQDVAMSPSYLSKM